MQCTNILKFIIIVSKCYATSTRCLFLPPPPPINSSTIQDLHFPVLSRILSFHFQDFPGQNWFSRTFQGLENPGKNPGLSRKRLNSVIIANHHQHCQSSIISASSSRHHHSLQEYTCTVHIMICRRDDGRWRRTMIMTMMKDSSTSGKIHKIL